MIIIRQILGAGVFVIFRGRLGLQTMYKTRQNNGAHLSCVPDMLFCGTVSLNLFGICFEGDVWPQDSKNLENLLQKDDSQPKPKDHGSERVNFDWGKISTNLPRAKF